MIGRRTFLAGLGGLITLPLLRRIGDHIRAEGAPLLLSPSRAIALSSPVSAGSVHRARPEPALRRDSSRTRSRALSVAAPRAMIVPDIKRGLTQPRQPA